jgi:hypothetical protein
MAMIHEEIVPRPPLEDAPTTALLRDAIDETRQLVRIEVALAKDEARKEIQALKAAGIAFGIALLAAVLALTTIVSTVVVLVGWVVGAIIAGVSLVLAVVLGLTGYRLLPKNPLVETRKRLEDDLHGLKEHVA